jgi:hypothetical protein
MRRRPAATSDANECWLRSTFKLVARYSNPLQYRNIVGMFGPIGDYDFSTIIEKLHGNFVEMGASAIRIQGDNPSAW